MTDHNNTKTEVEDHTYDISTVCKLTGLTSANLRIWEKRYQAVSPSRSSSGRRQYSRQDLQRLTLLKNLTDLGHSISSSAKLPIVELERRIEETVRPVESASEERDQSHACRICVIGNYLSTIMDSSEVMPDRAVKAAEFPDLETAGTSELPAIIDLLIVECPALFLEEIQCIEDLISRTKALRAIVFYSYTQSDVLESLESRTTGITAVRAPISPGDFKALCEADVALANRSAREVLKNAPVPGEKREGIPERKFSEEQLATIARLSTTVKCECPHQLVSLLQALNGFEIYSQQCENLNSADAEIHGYLHKSTAHARAVVEDALVVLLDFEGISPAGEI